MVYRAIDQQLKRDVATKLIPVYNDQTVARIRHEAEAAAALKHPGIVQPYQFGERSVTPFLVMEFVDGRSLASHLREDPMPVSDAVALFEKVASAVEFTHQNGVIYRDLKPGNILLDENLQPKVCDFGLAHRTDVNHTLHSTGDVIGTPAFISPEQARGESATKISNATLATPGTDPIYHQLYSDFIELRKTAEYLEAFGPQ